MALGKRVLSAEDDPAVSAFISSLLTISGYEVTSVSEGTEVLKLVREKKPDIILLDVGLPGVSGYEICKQIKQDVVLRHIPIIMLTALSALQNKVQGLDAGAEDYMTKPFEPEELLVRIRSILRGTSIKLDTNPLSYLPGNKSIEQKIRDNLLQGGLFAVLYLDLNNFKAYNDYYGFVRGDHVIQATARLILEAANFPKDFVGHVGGDDFIVVTEPGRAELLCQRVIDAFDAMSPSFYDEKERSRGCIEAADRQGNKTRFPLLSIAIGVVSNQWCPLGHIGEVSAIGSELKHYAKSHTGSFYAVDRRQKGYPAPRSEG